MDPGGHPGKTPAQSLKLDPIAQSLVQMYFEYMKGWRCHHLSEPLFQCYPYQIRSDFSLLQPVTAASYPFLCFSEKTVTLYFLKSHSR